MNEIVIQIMSFFKDYSTIIIPLILFIQAVYVTKLKSEDSKLINALDKKNANEHMQVFSELKTIDKAIYQITKYLDLDKENKDFIKIMNNVKDYYCDQIINPKLKEFAILRSKQFISLVEGIIENYDLQIQCLNPIKDSFYVSISSSRKDMESTFDKYVVEDYYRNHHNKEIEAYIIMAEDIVTDLENHHKERFLKVANKYLKESLKTLRLYENVLT